MRILLLDLDRNAREQLAAAAQAIAGDGSVDAFRSPLTVAAELRRPDADFDFVIIAGDDGSRLLGAYASLAATGRLPPTLIVSACNSAETAVSLLKAGAEDFILRDPEGTWQTRLPEEAAAIASRASARRLRDRSDADLRESQQSLAQIVDGSSVAMFVIDRQHRVTHWNRACEALTGIATSDVIGTDRHWQAFYAEERPCMADLIVNGAIEAQVEQYYGSKGCRHSPLLAGTYEAEDFFPNFGDDGRWLYFTAAPLKDSHGRTIGAIETLQDITERKRAREALDASEARLRQIIECSSVATFVIDASHRITHWNRACELLLGRSAASAIGARNVARGIYQEDRPVLADLVLDGADETEIERYYSGRYRKSTSIDGVFEVEDLFTQLPDGPRWLHFAAAPLRSTDGKTIGAIETLIDITERKRAEESLRESEERYRILSITDGMTGLYNARHFVQRLYEEMDRCQRYRHPLTLMLLDVDNFKKFNDTWGHVQGDQVLIRLAECITRCLRRSDQAFRYGGEEFVVLLPETDIDEAEAAAERVRAMFAETEIFPIPDQLVQCTASIGVTHFTPGETPMEFVARADSGTYEAKRLGKNRVIRVTPQADACGS